MKTISKKAFVYIIVGLLTFSSTYMSYYRSVHAMEWVGGALAFEEALKWTLAVLGITATAGMTDAYWDQYGDDFVDYAIEDGATQQEVTEWQMKLCEGVLDKASGVWTSFKNWANSLVQSSGGGSGVAFASGEYILNYCNSLQSSYTIAGLSVSGGSYTKEQFLSHQFTSFIIQACRDSNFTPRLFVFCSDDNVSISLNNGSYVYFTSNHSGYYCTWPTGFSYNNNINHFGALNNNMINTYGYGVTNVTGNLSDKFISIDGNTNINDDFQVAPGVTVPDVDVISADIPDEADPEITLPFPGLDSSDDSISSDTYDDIIGAINDGTISIEDGIDDIIGRLRVISYDTETGDVIPPRPDPDDPTENVKKDDVVNDNKNNMGFTLAGLEGVFPFCIPWDIYAFMTLLVADPVAPEFDFPIKSVNNRTENIHVDLEPFEPVAVVVRYIFDFLFIIGLGMLTRSMIGGGSSD